MSSLRWNQVGDTRQEMAKAFWTLSGMPDAFPRNIKEAAIWALPLAVIEVAGLEAEKVAGYPFLRDVARELLDLYDHRPLYGCVVGSRGVGFVFVDKTLPPDEFSLTVAHEVAHFIADYLVPRERALARLGDRILPVLDGERPPAPEERVEALLAGIPLGRFTDVTLADRLVEFEHDADLLALELLAPMDDVLRELGVYPAGGLSPAESFSHRGGSSSRWFHFTVGERVAPPQAITVSRIRALLVTRYGLPEAAAGWYAGYIHSSLPPGYADGGFAGWLLGRREG